jgi:membrane-bound serine protease (ClpP class)
MRVGLHVLVPATLAVAALAVTLVRLLLRSRRLPVTTGHEGLLGLVGRAETALDPEGWVLVGGEFWRARAGGRVPPGGRVVVTSVEGLTLGVRAEE